MSPHEVGCYMRLLCHQWSRGQIPHSDVQKIRRVAGGVVSDDVMRKFPNGKNERLERERLKQQVWREKSREGGIKSGLTRASRVLQPPLQPPLQPNGQPNGNTPSPSPVSLSIKTTKLPQSDKSRFTKRQTELTARFDKALGIQWENDRQKWMGRIKRNPDLSERVLCDLEQAIKDDDVKKGPAEYAQHRWEDFQHKSNQR